MVSFVEHKLTIPRVVVSSWKGRIVGIFMFNLSTTWCCTYA
jgi:hypothetical protein